MPLQQNLYNSRLRHSASTVMKKPIKKDFSPVRSSRSRSPNPSTNS